MARKPTREEIQDYAEETFGLRPTPGSLLYDITRNLLELRQLRYQVNVSNVAMLHGISPAHAEAAAKGIAMVEEALCQ